MLICSRQSFEYFDTYSVGFLSKISAITMKMIKKLNINVTAV